MRTLSLLLLRFPASVASEIRLVGNRDVIVEQMLVVLGADVFGDLALRTPIAPHARPRLVKGVRVLDGEGRFHHLAVVDYPPALDDVQLLGMRRTVIVDRHPVV